MRRVAVTLTLVVGLLAAGCSMNHASKARFCRQLRRTPRLQDVFSGYAVDGPAALRRKMRDAAAQFSTLERAAPRDIRSDVGVVADLVDKIVEAVDRSPDDPAAIQYRLRQVATRSTGAGKAVLRVADYSLRECKIDLNSPSGPGPATSSPLSSTPPSSPGATAPFGTAP